jgi:ribonuclease R
LAKKHVPGLPSQKAILDFITHAPGPSGKREIAKHFGLKGNEKIALKSLLKDMADEGLIDSGRGRAFHKMGGVPKVTVLRIISSDGDSVYGIPETWHGEDTPPPKLRIIEPRGKGRMAALGVGDRILARTEERGGGHVAHPMKRLAAAAETMLGVVEVDENSASKRHWLRPIDKKARHMLQISDIGDAQPGQLVTAELSGRGAQVRARVSEVLGEPFAPKALSLIAIHKFGIPNVFTSDHLDDAVRSAKLPLSADARRDLRHLPIIAIDPADARDFDDAVWATPDDDPKNAGGFKAIVAIADVAFYVRPGSALDKEARRRGNSVYFPDRVVPMLPEALSADACSLRAGEDKAALACELTISADGTLKSWLFSRALIRIAANIPYEKAQAAMDGTEDHPLLETAIKPLWACWAALAKARDDRAPLDLDLPERRVMLNDAGQITSVAIRERLDAHRLIEDFMIAANVAAAKALEAKKAPCMYRVHEAPAREKLVALKDYLETFDISFALGQVVRPSTFNAILAKVENAETKIAVQEQVLRTQTQAYYAPANQGHFGLALGSYAHFTSPIRRYADLLVHRALVDSYAMEQPVPADKSVPKHSGLAKDDAANFDRIGTEISRAERRAMEAERETLDRYVAAYLSTKQGEIIEARITGVQNFGFFATVDGLGGDGLVPVSTLGAERFFYDEKSNTLEGQETGTQYSPGQRLHLRLVEANPVSGALRFELPEFAENGGFGARDFQHKRRPIQRRGRPANLRHQ